MKILHVITGMGSGGAESMIMNWYRNIDRDKVQFDFLLRSSENIYKDEISRLGGKVYYMPEFPKHYFSNYSKTGDFFKEHAADYSAIHVHGNALIYTNVFHIAKKYNIEKRIMHSHSTSTKSKLFLPVHKFNKMRIKHMANEYFACSDEAGKWCFNKDYKVINNGIDVERFRFNEQKRETIRQSLAIDDDAVVFCHVGRFLEVKNHEFIFKVFSEYRKTNQNADLILVGVGPLMEKYQNMANNLNIADRVHFLGVRTDIPDIISAADIFIFPSIYEGLPLSLVEAQANGICCLASDAITKKSKVSDNIKYLSIKGTPKAWCDEIALINFENRKNAYISVEKCDFNIKQIAKSIQNYYLNM